MRKQKRLWRKALYIGITDYRMNITEGDNGNELFE